MPFPHVPDRVYMELDRLDAAKLQGQSLDEAEDIVKGCTVLVSFQCYSKHGWMVWTNIRARLVFQISV